MAAARGTKVAFSAQKTSGNSFNGDITYDSVPVNISPTPTRMNARTGEFTAPVSGTYVFSFSAMTGTSSGYVVIDVLKNDVSLFEIKDGNSNGDSNNISYSWMSVLNSGDKIKLSVRRHQLYADLDDIVLFNGFLL